jgi:hypothetical protein
VGVACEGIRVGHPLAIITQSVCLLS